MLQLARRDQGLEVDVWMLSVGATDQRMLLAFSGLVVDIMGGCMWKWNECVMGLVVWEQSQQTNRVRWGHVPPQWLLGTSSPACPFGWNSAFLCSLLPMVRKLTGRSVDCTCLLFSLLLFLVLLEIYLWASSCTDQRFKCTLWRSLSMLSQ